MKNYKSILVVIAVFFAGSALALACGSDCKKVSCELASKPACCGHCQKATTTGDEEDATEPQEHMKWSGVLLSEGTEEAEEQEPQEHMKLPVLLSEDEDHQEEEPQEHMKVVLFSSHDADDDHGNAYGKDKDKGKKKGKDNESCDTDKKKDCDKDREDKEEHISTGVQF